MFMLGIGTSRVSIIFKIDPMFSWISDMTMMLEEALLLLFDTMV